MARAAHRGERAGTQTGGGALRRAQERWGMARLQLVHGAPATGPEDLGRVLHRALRHHPVILLHDRRVDDGSVVDHLAIGPGGVTVIGAADDLAPPLRVERISGVFGARAEALHDRHGDRSDRVLALREQVFSLRRLLADSVSVKGALCPQALGVAQLHGLEVGGVLVAGPEAVAALACRDVDKADLDVPALVDRLDRTLEPVFGRFVP